MTDEQRKQITNMRMNGLAYNAIAQAIGLSINTVKSYCRRNNVSSERENITPHTVGCLQCGKELHQKPGKKTAKFCSDACRRKRWNAHPEQVNRKAIYKGRCGRCGKEFEAYGNNHRKYCSHECYINARFKGGALDG